jgi:hypothetical protein
MSALERQEHALRSSEYRAEVARYTGDTFAAVGMVEGFSDEESNPERMRAAWQALVNTGLVWRLQGAYGRGATDLIRAGELMSAGDWALYQETEPATHQAERSADTLGPEGEAC